MIMKGKAAIVSLIALVCVLFSCSKSDDCHNTIMMKNSTDKTIYYVYTLEEGFFNFDPTNENYAVDLKVKPGENKMVRIGFQLSCWEHVIANSGGHVYFYIYDADFLEADTTEWQGAKNKYLKKYKLSVSDLKKMNWSIDYTN